MLLGIISVVTFLGSIISATNICINSSPCKCILSVGNVIDISSVGNFSSPRFYEIKSDNTNDSSLYSYNPCYGFDSPDRLSTVKTGNYPCKSAAACVRTPGGNNGELPEEHTIGLQSTGIFGSIKSSGHHINYSVPNAKQKLMVYLNCSENAVTHSLFVETSESEENNLVTMTLVSKCACVNGCSSNDPVSPDEGLSAGSKLLIAFFTILLAYFVIGIVWNFCNGAQGFELVPNYEFWNELPKLVAEGLAFTCSCFGRKSAYGEV